MGGSVSSPAQDEGGERRFSTERSKFHGAERVRAHRRRETHTNETVVMSADLVLIRGGLPVFPDLNSINRTFGDAYRHLARQYVGRRPTGRVDALGGHAPVLLPAGDAVRG